MLCEIVASCYQAFLPFGYHDLIIFLIYLVFDSYFAPSVLFAKTKMAAILE